MKKIIYKDLKEILEMLDDSKLDKLWKKYSVDNKKSYCDKEDMICKLSMLLVEDFLINIIDENKIYEKFLIMLEYDSFTGDFTKFIDENLIFEINGSYYIPLDYKDDDCEDDIDEISEVLVQYYLFINGCIQLDKLVSLMSESGLNTTKSRIIEICNCFDYKIEKDVIYFNNFAKSLNTDNLLIDIKNKRDYYVVDIDNVYDIFEYVLNIGDFHDIDKYLINLKDDYLVDCIKNDLFMITLFNNNLPAMIKEYLKSKLISEKQLEGIIKCISEIAQDTPCWIFNGYSQDDIGCVNEIESFSKKYGGNRDFDEIRMYIYDYVAINGVISVDKIYDLLLNVHKFNTSKKEIDKHIKILTKNKTILKINNLLAIVPGTKLALQDFYENKHTYEYKIIDDMKSIEWDSLDVHLKVDQLCDKYKFNDRLRKIILFITQVDVFSQEKFEDLLSTDNIIISQSIKNKVISEIKKINKDARLWMYNGFTINEVKTKKIPLK